jgi:hypothetical protein
MDELILLMDIWENRRKELKNGKPTKKIVFFRKVELIVPRITYENGRGNLHNDHWAYQVPYAFREALDIKYEERFKETQPYSVWTQGCLLNFLVGDMFKSIHGEPCLQIKDADPMSFDEKNDVLYEGNVTYERFFEKGIIEPITVSQMEFLKILIYGGLK